MPDNILLDPVRSTTIEAFADVVDAYTGESFELSTTFGQSPLENGAVITDHAVRNPVKIMLEGEVSDLTEQGASRPVDAFATLDRVWRELEPMTVTTPWGVFSNMMIEKLEAHREANAMTFTMKLEEILFVGLAEQAINFQAGGLVEERTSEVDSGSISPEGEFEYLSTEELTALLDTPVDIGEEEDPRNFFERTSDGISNVISSIRDSNIVRGARSAISETTRALGEAVAEYEAIARWRVSIEQQITGGLQAPANFLQTQDSYIAANNARIRNSTATLANTRNSQLGGYLRSQGVLPPR